MALIEVKMVSGFEPVKEHLDQVDSQGLSA